MKDTYWYAILVDQEKSQEFISILKEQGCDVFVPSMERLHRKQGTYFKVMMEIFPNYLFISTELKPKEFEKWLAVNDSVPLKKEMIRIIHEKERYLLEHLMNEDYVVQHSTGMIEQGTVMITDGPLMGLEKNIAKIDRHKRTAMLNPMILETQIKVSLEITKKI